MACVCECVHTSVHGPMSMCVSMKRRHWLLSLYVPFLKLYNKLMVVPLSIHFIFEELCSSLRISAPFLLSLQGPSLSLSEWWTKGYSCEKWSENLSVMSYSLWPRGLEPASLLCLWNSSDKHTGVGNCSRLQGIFPTEGLNPGLLHWRQILYQLSH